MKKESTIEKVINAEMEGVESNTHKLLDFKNKFEAMKEKTPEERFTDRAKAELNKIQKNLEDLAEIQAKKIQKSKDEASAQRRRQERISESQKNGYPEGWEPTEKLKQNTRALKIETTYKNRAFYHSQEQDLAEALNSRLLAIKKDKLEQSLKTVKEAIETSLSKLPLEEIEKKELHGSVWNRIKTIIGDWFRRIGGKIQQWKNYPSSSL